MHRQTIFSPHYAHTVDPRVDADLKSVVYPVGIAYGGEEEWEFVWDQYLSSSDPYEKRLFLSALGKSRIPWILSRWVQQLFFGFKKTGLLFFLSHSPSYLLFPHF